MVDPRFLNFQALEATFGIDMLEPIEVVSFVPVHNHNNFLLVAEEALAFVGLEGGLETAALASSAQKPFVLAGLELVVAEVAHLGTPLVGDNSDFIGSQFIEKLFATAPLLHHGLPHADPRIPKDVALVDSGLVVLGVIGQQIHKRLLSTRAIQICFLFHQQGGVHPVEHDTLLSGTAQAPHALHPLLFMGRRHSRA